MPTPLKVLVTVLALVLAGVHVLLPSVTVDTITLILVVIAALPWLIRYVKEFEIPGIVKITLPDAKAITDKIEQGNIVLIPQSELKLKGYAPTVVVSEKPGTAIDNLRLIAESDPNLAMVGFRIEVEKRIKRLAQLNGMPIERRGLNRLIRELSDENVLSRPAAGGLLDLVGLGNQAAHGAEVTRDAAEWVLDVGPDILRQLEATESDASGSND